MIKNLSKLEPFNKTQFYAMQLEAYLKDAPKIIRSDLEYENIVDEKHVIDHLEGQTEALSSIGIQFQKDTENAYFDTPDTKHSITQSFVFYDGIVIKGCYSWLVPMHPTIETLIFEKVVFDENLELGGQVYLTQSPNLKTIVLLDTKNSIELQQLKLTNLICLNGQDYKNVIPKKLKVEKVTVNGFDIKPLQGLEKNKNSKLQIIKMKDSQKQKRQTICDLRQFFYVCIDLNFDDQTQ